MRCGRWRLHWRILKIWGEYTLTTSLRDTQIWPSANGVTAQWIAMGEGMVDWKGLFQTIRRTLPGCSGSDRNHLGIQSRTRLQVKRAFGSPGRRGSRRALRASRNGQPRVRKKSPHKSASNEAEQKYQLGEIERSIAYCKSIGLGVKK